MKECLDPSSNQICCWCGAPSGECGCGYKGEKLPSPDWEKIIEVYGEDGLPSCGLTDARRLGSTGEEQGTTYLGGKKTQAVKNQ